ncbi:MAG: transporter [Planctomycetes bacterium]|nr:transporter [Planctomycetota bacterium]
MAHTQHVFVLAALLASCSAPGARLRPIASDRPGFLFAPTLVPRGALQLELGLPNVESSRSAHSELQRTTATAQARYGATAYLELRLAATPLALEREEHGASTNNEHGSGDLELGFKLALPTSSPAALIASVRAPTGERPFTSDDPAYALSLVADLALADDTIARALLGLSRTPSGPSELDAAALALALSRTLSERWSVFVESAWFPALERGPDPLYVGAGVAWLAADATQLDAALERGLGHDASDWIASLGLTWSW